MTEQLTTQWKGRFLSVAYAFLIVMLGTTMPTPLYPIYGEQFGLSGLMITIIYAVYAVGVIGALLFFGHMADSIGAKPILLAGVLLSFGSAIIFLSATNTGILFVGRILSGMSAGVFTGTASAALVNIAPAKKQATASMLASGVNMFGLGLGPLAAGIMAEFFPFPIRLIFIIDAILLIPAFIFILKMTEQKATKGKFKLKIQKLSIPKQVRPTFIKAVIPGFIGFAVLGLFSSVSAIFLADVLHFDNKAIVGLIVFLCFLSSAGAQSIFTKVDNNRILSVGSGILIIGIMLVGGALYLQSLILIILSAIISGVGQGFSFRSGLAAINAKTPTEKRSEVTSSFFTIAYIALSIPVIGVGAMAKWTDIQIAGIIFSVIIAIIAVGAFVYSLVWKD